MRYDTGFTPSEPSGAMPPVLIFAKSVYVPLSLRVTPTFGGAGWLLNLTQRHSSSSRAFRRQVFPFQYRDGKTDKSADAVREYESHGLSSVVTQVNKPVHLKRLMECPWRMFRYDRAVFSNRQKVLTPLWIRFNLRHLCAQARHNGVERDDSIAGNIHCAKLFKAAVSVRVAVKTSSAIALLCLF